MKRLLLVTLLCFGLSPMLFAQEQNTSVSDEDYERMIENYLEVKFRSFAFESLELTEDEILAFDPVYRSYMDSKSALIDKKMRLVKEYEDEMAEDDSAEDEADETGDFIENYWEVEIEEMELKKDYFDRIEDMIGPDRAAAFFLMEEAVQDRLQQVTLVQVVPMIVDVERKFNEEYGTSYDDVDTNRSDSDKDMARTDMDKNKSEWSTDKDVAKTDMDKDKSEWSTDKDVAKTDMDKDKMAKEDKTNWSTDNTNNTNTNSYTGTKGTANQLSTVKAFTSWVENPNSEVGYSHVYTKTGLHKLTDAITALSQASNNPVTNVESKAKKIKHNADQMTVNWRSLKHADWARESFDMAAAMLQELRDNNDLKDSEGVIDQVAAAARQMNPDEWTTRQAETIYSFFRHSKQAIELISNQISWPTAGADANSNE